MKKGHTKLWEEFKAAKSFRKVKEKSWLSYYNIWRCISERDTEEGQSDIYLPEVFSVIETIMPYMVSNPPKWGAKAGGIDDTSKVPKVDMLLDYYWDIMKMKRQTPPWIKEGLIYGTAFAKLGWDNVKDIPFFDPVDIYNIWIDPRAQSIEDSKKVFHRIPDVPIKDVKENQEYSNTSKIEPKNSWEDDAKKERLQAQGFTVPPTIDEDTCDLVEVWTTEKVVIFANDSTVIYDKPNHYGFIPFVYWNDQEVPHELYGVGEPEYLGKLNYLVNDITNLRLDNVNLNIHNMWIKTPQSDIDDSTLITTPGGIIETLDINGIQPLKKENVTADAYQEADRASAAIVKASGTYDYARGNTGDSAGLQRTATGVSLIQEAAVSRFRKRIQNFEFAIEEMGEMLILMTKKFLDAGKMMRITGEEGDDFMEIFPEDLEGQFDIRVEAGSTAPVNENIKRNEAEIMFTMFKDDPLINQYQLRKLVIERYGEKNVDVLLKSPEEKEAEIEALEQEKQNVMQEEMPGEMSNVIPGEEPPAMMSPENVPEENIQPPDMGGEGMEEEGTETPVGEMMKNPELPIQQTEATPQGQGALKRIVEKLRQRIGV